MSKHIIVGYGNWAKKILIFLLKNNIFKKIYVYRRKNSFVFINSIKTKYDKNINEEFKDAESAHICTPTNLHFKDLKKFQQVDKIIIEKPLFSNIKEYKMFNSFKNNFILVNYVYLFNPLINKLKKKINKKNNFKIIINLSNKNKFYKKKFDSIFDWLDHPLSIILYIFKHFSKFKLQKFETVAKKNGYYEKLIFIYKFKNCMVVVKINEYNIDKKLIECIDNLKIESYDLKKNEIISNKKKTFFSKKSSFDILYLNLKKRKKISFQNINFHKKIYIEKLKIIQIIKNEKK